MTKKKLSIFIGFDPREAACFAVAKNSAERLLTQPVPIKPLILSDLRERGIYKRGMRHMVEYDESWRHVRTQMWDVPSDAPMSTEFACSRFLVPKLAGEGLALFVDCDVMFRVNPLDVFRLHEEGKAVSCVKHRHVPTAAEKMDGQVQTRYARKNWSSVMIFDCGHSAHAALTDDMLANAPGRDLHAFSWLDDEYIGGLPARWNYLVGHTVLPPAEEPAIVHWTDGAPCMKGFERVEYADEFNEELRLWAR